MRVCEEASISAISSSPNAYAPRTGLSYKVEETSVRMLSREGKNKVTRLTLALRYLTSTCWQMSQSHHLEGCNINRLSESRPTDRTMGEGSMRELPEDVDRNHGCNSKKLKAPTEAK